MQKGAPKSLVIIGAGMAGLGNAWGLANSHQCQNILMLEKSKKVGGRVASNSRQGYIYDHGANYFNFDGLMNSKFMEDIIRKQIPTEDLVEIKKGIYLFNKDNQIYPSQKGDISLKLTYKQGITQLPQLLSKEIATKFNNKGEGQSFQIQFESQVQSLKYDQNKWIVTYKDIPSNTHKSVEADFVLVTAPAPQIADLFSNSTYKKKEEIIKIFSDCQYTKSLSVVLAFNQKQLPEEEFSALLNEDRQHEISWIQFAHHKPYHVPENKSMFVVQMSDQFSEGNWNSSEDIVFEKINLLIKKLLPNLNLSTLELNWIKKWRYALPKGKQIEEAQLEQFRQEGLFFAGDFLIGKGRVLQAFEKGLNSANNMTAKF